VPQLRGTQGAKQDTEQSGASASSSGARAALASIVRSYTTRVYSIALVYSV